MILYTVLLLFFVVVCTVGIVAGVVHDDETWYPWLLLSSILLFSVSCLPFQCGMLDRPVVGGSVIMFLAFVCFGFLAWFWTTPWLFFYAFILLAWTGPWFYGFFITSPAEVRRLRIDRELEPLKLTSVDDEI